MKGKHDSWVNEIALYTEYIMWNPGLDESQSGIKIAWRNISNLIHVDDTNLMAESDEKLKHLLVKAKDKSEKDAFKLNIQKIKIMASGTIISWQTEGEKVEVLTNSISLMG